MQPLLPCESVWLSLKQEFLNTHLCPPERNYRQQNPTPAGEDAPNLLNKALLALVSGKVLGHAIRGLHNHCIWSSVMRLLCLRQSVLTG